MPASFTHWINTAKHYSKFTLWVDICHGSFMCLIYVMLFSWIQKFILNSNSLFLSKISFLFSLLLSIHSSFIFYDFFCLLCVYLCFIFLSFYLYLFKLLTLIHFNFCLFFIQTHWALPKLAMFSLKENKLKSK